MTCGGPTCWSGAAWSGEAGSGAAWSGEAWSGGGSVPRATTPNRDQTETTRSTNPHSNLPTDPDHESSCASAASRRPGRTHRGKEGPMPAWSTRPVTVSDSDRRRCTSLRCWSRGFCPSGSIQRHQKPRDQHDWGVNGAGLAGWVVTSRVRGRIRVPFATLRMGGTADRCGPGGGGARPEPWSS